MAKLKIFESQNMRCSRILRALALLVVLCMLVLVAVVVVVYQPLLPGESPAVHQLTRADPARLRQAVTGLCGRYPQRTIEHPEELLKVAQDIQSQLQAQPRYQVKLQSFLLPGLGGVGFANVRAELRSGSQIRRKLVVGAHYDVAEGTPGADDNASGIAALLELARILADQRLAADIEFVAYTLEEPPTFRSEFMGSKQHVLGLAKEGVEVIAMLGLEMLGYYCENEECQSYPHPALNLLYPRQGDFVAVISNLQNILLTRKVKAAMRAGGALPVYSLNAPSFVPGVDFSDHMNYWHANIPAVMISDTAFYRNTAYHRSYDTPDRLDYRRMALAVDGIAQAIVVLASSP